MKVSLNKHLGSVNLGDFVPLLRILKILKGGVSGFLYNILYNNRFNHQVKSKNKMMENNTR